MPLQQQIDEELLKATKAGEAQTRDTLRLLKSALKNFGIEKNLQDLSDDQVREVIGREVKKRKESILAYEQVNKPDLAKTEQEEAVILQKYLPEQLSEDQIRQKVQDYLKTQPNVQIGQAMGQLSAELKGKADLGLVNKILRETIGN